MSQRLQFDQQVALLVDFYEENNGGRVRAVLYRRHEDAPYATQLAAIMGVPARYESAVPSQQAS